MQLKKFELPQDFDNKISLYTELLLKYNKTHNICGAKNSASALSNIEDSLYALEYLECEPKSAIDIGTGAGFPGIVLALALPNCHFSLFEPIAKKSAFLHLVKSELNLTNVTVCTQRVEDATPLHVELITSRAVTNTKMLLKLCDSFIGPDTTLLLYKGTSVNEEIDSELNYQIHERGNRRYLLIKGLK